MRCPLALFTVGHMADSDEAAQRDGAGVPDPAVLMQEQMRRSLEMQARYEAPENKPARMSGLHLYADIGAMSATNKAIDALNQVGARSVRLRVNVPLTGGVVEVGAARFGKRVVRICRYNGKNMFRRGHADETTLSEFTHPRNAEAISMAVTAAADQEVAQQLYGRRAPSTGRRRGLPGLGVGI